MDIQEVIPLFLTHGKVERGYARQTVDKHRDCLQAWILPYFRDRSVESISRLDILAFRSEMTAAQLGTNRQYSILMVLKLLLGFCRAVPRLSTLDPREIAVLVHGLSGIPSLHFAMGQK